MLGPDDLVLCAGTLGQAPLPEKLEAAGKAGFTGVSVMVSDYRRAREEGCSDAELRALLAGHGLEVAELDPLMSWVPAPAGGPDVTDEGAEFLRHGEAEFYAAAEALGARSINAVAVTDAPVEPAALAEAFAGLCDRAAERGLLVHLEFLPWTQVRDARSALEIVERAGRRNGGILLDTWHHFRGGGGARALCEIPGERVLAIQLSDAPTAAEPDPIDETLHRRLLPGEGAIDLVGVLRALREAGCSAPVGVEIFSDALAALPAAEAARRAAEAARVVLERAGRTHGRSG